MSDSVGTRNVEDVLSSVRRLVSNELPKMPRAAPSVGDGALVLTEAQRIGGRTAPEQPPRPKSLEERIAELEAAVSLKPDEFEPDGSEDLAQHRPDRIVYSARRDSRPRSRAPLRLSRIALIETEPANPDPADEAGAPVSFRHGGEGERQANGRDDDADDETRRTLSRAIADAFVADPDFEDALADAVTATLSDRDAVEAPEPETDDPDTGTGEAQFVEAGAEAAKPEQDPGEEPQDAASEPELDGTPPEVAFSEPASEPEEATENDVAPEPETAPEAFAAEPAFEPEDATETDVALEPETAALEDDAPAPQAAAPDPAPAPLPRSEPDQALSADTDELRRVVGSLIREELRGELGERITRNVRKLVRREISRALDARTYE